MDKCVLECHNILTLLYGAHSKHDWKCKYYWLVAWEKLLAQSSNTFQVTLCQKPTPACSMMSLGVNVWVIRDTLTQLKICVHISGSCEELCKKYSLEEDSEPLNCTLHLMASIYSYNIMQKLMVPLRLWQILSNNMFTATLHRLKLLSSLSHPISVANSKNVACHIWGQVSTLHRG